MFLSTFEINELLRYGKEEGNKPGTIAFIKYVWTKRGRTVCFYVTGMMKGYSTDRTFSGEKELFLIGYRSHDNGMLLGERRSLASLEAAVGDDEPLRVESFLPTLTIILAEKHQAEADAQAAMP